MQLFLALSCGAKIISFRNYASNFSVCAWILPCFSLIFPLFVSCHSSDQLIKTIHGSRINGTHLLTDMAGWFLPGMPDAGWTAVILQSEEIQEILDNGTINYDKSEPNAQPDPKYAVEGYTAEQQHLRIIVAPENEKLIIITCIELGVEWQCHCN